MASNIRPTEMISVSSLDDYMERRHKTKYRRSPSRDGLTISLLLQLLHWVDSGLGSPHRAYLKLALQGYFRRLRAQGVAEASAGSLARIDLYAIDIWTGAWPLIHLVVIFPAVYSVTGRLASDRPTGWGAVLLGLVLYMLSVYRYADIIVTLGRLHLAPEYVPHTSPRAILGTLLQFVDIVAMFASTYLWLRAILGPSAFSGSAGLFSTILAPLYYSLVAVTLNLGSAEFFAVAWPVQTVVVLEFFTGIFLLIVILQKVISPGRTRFVPQYPYVEETEIEPTGQPGCSQSRDRFYAAFLDRFRHSEEFVRALFDRFPHTFKDRTPVLDIGCGRGEFLEVMRGADIEAYGVDTNTELLRRCRRKDLDVRECDWRQHLRLLPDGRLGGIFSAQFVEHLDTEELVELFELAHAKLRPNGVLVVETLTPCLNTMISKFYVDFTHKAPLNPDALAFLASEVGFRAVEVEYYNEPSEDEKLHEIADRREDDNVVSALNRSIKILNRLIFRPHYFCLVARKGVA